MTMQAITKISKGEEITHAYTEPLDPVMTRKSILSLGKFFQVYLSLKWVCLYTHLCNYYNHNIIISIKIIGVFSI